jgi:hypothetical protein
VTTGEYWMGVWVCLFGSGVWKGEFMCVCEVWGLVIECDTGLVIGCDKGLLLSVIRGWLLSVRAQLGLGGDEEGKWVIVEDECGTEMW